MVKRVWVSKFARKYMQNRAKDLMTDTVRVWQPGDVVLDTATGRTKRLSEKVVYQGPARIYEVPEGSTVYVSDEKMNVSSTYISFPVDIDPIPEGSCLVKVLDAEDPDLIGRVFDLDAYSLGGGLRSRRRFAAQLSTSDKETW